MRRKVLVVSGSLLAIAVLLAFAWWGWLQREPKEPSTPLAQKPQPEQPSRQPGITLEGVEGFVLRREGRKTWELFVDLLTLDKDQTQATAQGIRKAIYYDEKGKPLLWFSARMLLYDHTKGEVTLTGDIQLEARLPKGRMLVGKATQAVWRERQRMLEVWEGQGQVGETRFLVRHIRYYPDKTVLEGLGEVVVFTPRTRLVCPMVRTNLTTRYLIALPPIRLTVMAKGSSAPFLPVAFRQEGKNGKQQKAEEKKERPVDFQTDKPVVRKPPRWFFEQVLITEEGEDYKITAQRAIYDEETDRVTIEGGIRFEDPETLATAPKGEVDNKQKVATFFGPVEVIIKPKKEEAPQKNLAQESNQAEGEKQAEQEKDKKERLRERVRKEGGKMVCDKAEYFYRERRIVASGNVRFEQEGRYKGSAERAIYLTRDEVLTLEGNVVAQDLRKGHQAECPKIVVNLQTDEVEISPPVRMRLIVREEEEEEKKPPSPPTEPKASPQGQ